MTDPTTEVNDAIRARSTPLYRLLSPLGRRVVFPPGIPFQAAQARGKAFNGTIGQITDGHGHAVPVTGLVAGLGGLDEEARNRGLLYSPVQGLPELREAWRRWQRRGQPESRPSSTPLVTVGLTHGLSLVADLFAGEGRAVAVPAPFWGNYRQTFATRTGARLLTAPAYVDGRYNSEAIAQALAEVPDDEPAIAILNLPSNPGGYSLTAEERGEVLSALLRECEDRPLLVVCDDAYAGLVYEDGISAESMYWELVGRHPNLLPVKVDGATKEVSFFGGRVGFLSFPFDPGTEIEAALESKVKCLVRATVGSPVATSQALLLGALASDSLESEVESVRGLLAERYRALASLLAEHSHELVRPLPFNSGCFALLELSEALGHGSEAVRQRLLADYDLGLVAIPPRYLRIAFCSVAVEALPELVERLMAGVEAMA